VGGPRPPQRGGGEDPRGRALPFLTELHNLFYPNGIKSIPAGVIMYHLVSPIALAHWLCGDGTWHGCGVIICTDSFTVPEVVHLMNVLMVRYHLVCSLRMHNGSPRIYIQAESMPLLRSIVVPYMPASMLYHCKTMGI
jgi:hypothetical protein